MVIPWEVAVVVAMVTGDLPLVWADWLVVETELLVEGELVWGRWPAALVIAARRPSGFVPYCTGWNNLIRKNNHVVWMWEYQYNQFTFYKFLRHPRTSTSTLLCYQQILLLTSWVLLGMAWVVEVDQDRCRSLLSAAVWSLVWGLPLRSDTESDCSHYLSGQIWTCLQSVGIWDKRHQPEADQRKIIKHSRVQT